MSYESRTVMVDQMNIRYLTAGEGDTPVVLLHGAGVDSAELSWRLTIEPLAWSRRVIAPDLPGYGQSDKPDITYNTDFYIDFLSHFLDALHLEKVSLAGLSMGGAVALGFTLRYPGRVEKLALVDSYGIMPRTAWHRISYLYVNSPLNELTYRIYKRSKSLLRWSLAYSLISDPERITPELVEEVYQAAQDPAAGKAFTSYQRFDLTWNGLRTDFTSRLGELDLPVIFIHGEKDAGVPLEYARQAHVLVKGSRLVILPGCKHWPQRDKPDEFNRALAQFLN